MCGIAGILRFDGVCPTAEALKSMTDIMAHRGPDNEGLWINGPIGFGHRRLSIIDLSDRAAQPMKTLDESLIIVFNGEIYNYAELSADLRAKGYQFRTNSDTEVLLNLYREFGVGCLQRLRGMFAFALWDRSKNALLIVRDRVGIKPLFYTHKSQGFAFASELKGIAASGLSDRRINNISIAQYFRFLSVPQPLTMYEDVQKLEPGHYLWVTAQGAVSNHRYWSAEHHISSKEIGETELTNSLEITLRESIGYHLVSDVPVGAFLSGGLDSSGIVAMMRAVAPNQKIDTFSTIFPGLPDYDEGAFARRVSKAMHTVHHESTIDEAAFMHHFERIAWFMDEPFAIGSAAALYFLSEEAALHTKVVLSGDGGDELFGGYHGYTNSHYLKHNDWQLRSLGQIYAILRQIEVKLRPKSPTFLRALTKFRELSGSEGLRYSEQVAQNSLHAMSTVLDRGMFVDCLQAWNDNLMAQYYDVLDSPDRLLRKLYSEFKTRLVDEMLTKVDRMTMAHSLEARVPLLDHKVVEFAFACPSDYKIRQVDGKLVGKYLFKKTMEHYLPEDIIYRLKQGYNVPVSNWLGGKFFSTVRDVIESGYLMRSGKISRIGLERLISQQKNKTHNYNNMLFSIVAFEYWYLAFEKI